MSDEEIQGKEWTDHIKVALEAEYMRRGELDARATSAVTSAGGLLTLTIAVFALFLGSNFKLEGAERNWMALAFGLLLVCAICGVFASFSWSYTVANEATLRAMIVDKWEDDEVDARNSVAKTNIDTIVSLRSGSTRKYKLLRGAYAAQAASIGALSMSALYAFT